jgi:glycosyltransferase involved in cell wall biosynthesis
MTHPPLAKPDSDRYVAATGLESSPKLSLVIPTHRRPERCQRLLKSLCQQTLDPKLFEVIVVDDASGDETGDVLRRLVEELPFRLRPMQTERNRGPGPARNLAWRAANAPIVAFTDDDCLPDPNWLEQGLKVMSSDPHLGVAQGRTEADDLPLLYSDRWNHAIHITEPSPYFETCNIFYRRAALEEGGGFGEDYNWWGGWYCEDTLAGWRVVDAGWGRGFAPDALVSTGVERRRIKWWINKSLVHYIEVDVASKHPGFRSQAWWRPWAPRRHDAAFALGLAGLLTATRRPWAAVLAVPYMVIRRPPVRQAGFTRRCMQTVSVDAARFAGILYGAVRSRIFVI